MKLAIKKPVASGDPALDRALKKVYDDLNDIIKSINSPEGDINDAKAKKGDIRVNDKGFEFHDGKGWEGTSPKATATGDTIDDLETRIAVNEVPDLHWVTAAPEQSGSPGTPGEMSYGVDGVTPYAYICVLDNIWARVEVEIGFT